MTTQQERDEAAKALSELCDLATDVAVYMVKHPEKTVLQFWDGVKADRGVDNLWIARCSAAAATLEFMADAYLAEVPDDRNPE